MYLYLEIVISRKQNMYGALCKKFEELIYILDELVFKCPISTESGIYIECERIHLHLMLITYIFLFKLSSETFSNADIFCQLLKQLCRYFIDLFIGQFHLHPLMHESSKMDLMYNSSVNFWTISGQFFSHFLPIF